MIQIPSKQNCIEHGTSKFVKKPLSEHPPPLQKKNVATTSIHLLKHKNEDYNSADIHYEYIMIL